MSTIFILNGIFIRMYANEYNPPHFHAYYQGHKAVIDIQKCKMIKGNLHPKQRKKVEKWVKK